MSIDPTAEGRQKFEEFMKAQRTFNPAVLPVAARALGPQQVTLTGVPTDSHFARILFAADYRMKRLAMNLEKAPIRRTARLPGHAQVQGTAARHRHAALVDGLQLRTAGAERRPAGLGDPRPRRKALTEDEVVAVDGTVQGTGQADPIAKQWADLLTEHYTALAAKDPTLAQLRNLMDLCVVAAVIKREDLVGLSGGRASRCWPARTASWLSANCRPREPSSRNAAS